MKIVERCHEWTPQSPVILDIHGMILIGDDAYLREALERNVFGGRRKIVLNLAHCRLVDAAGIGELARCKNLVEREGGRLILLHVTKKINDLVTISRLVTVFDIYDNEDEALASFDQQACPPPPAAA